MEYNPKRRYEPSPEKIEYNKNNVSLTHIIYFIFK